VAVNNLWLNSAAYPRYGTVLNTIFAPINYLKSFQLEGPSGFRTAKNYPNGTTVVSVGSQGVAPDNYYDEMVLKWDGQASWSALGASIILYSKTANITVSGLSGSQTQFNLACSSTNVTGNRMTFKFGSLITGVSGGGGAANVTLTLPFSVGALSVGSRVKVQNGVSTSLATGPNDDGSWTVLSLGTGTVTLANSIGVLSPTITSTGGPGVQSEIVTPFAGIGWNCPAATYANFDNAVYCKLTNETLVSQGRLVDPDYIAQVKELRPAWLRHLDLTYTSGGNMECNFSARTPVNSIAWPKSRMNPSYDVGTITNTGTVSNTDVYTCSAPALTSTGAYKHGEVIIGVLSAANVNPFATLNVNGRGAKRIIYNYVPQRIFVNGPATSAGTNIAFTWTIGGVSLGTFTYVTTASGSAGSDLADAHTLQNNIRIFLNAQAALSGKATFDNEGSAIVACYPLTPQAGTQTLTYTGPSYVTVGHMAAGNLSGTYTFIFNYIMAAWIAQAGPQIQAVPIEYMVELSNLTNASPWYNISVITSSDMVNGVVGHFRDNLNPGLRLMLEDGNEIWNFGAFGWNQSLMQGFALGLANAVHSDNGASYSFHAARHRQYGAMAVTTWTATRPRADLYLGVMSAEWDQSATDQYFLGCQELSNATYLAYGGLDGTDGSGNAASDYTAAPNRVADNFDAFGFAPYWGSDYLGGDATNCVGGTLANYAPFFNAVVKYKSGNFSGAYDDMYNQLYSPLDFGGHNGGLNLRKEYKDNVYRQAEAICRKYDPARRASIGKPIAVIHYEAGPQCAIASNFVAGTNNATTDIAAVSYSYAQNIVNSGWDISPYTTASQTPVSITSGTYNSGTGQIVLTLNTAVTIPTGAHIIGVTGTGTNLSSLNGGWQLTAPVVSSTTLTLQGPGGQGTITITGGSIYLNAIELATNTVGWVFNFKFSQQYYNLYYQYMMDVVTMHAGREACGSQYGYDRNQWGIFPVNWTRGSGAAYKSYQAIADFNAGK
jgi:hypothetical protein